MRKSHQIEEKEDRLWKMFEREREQQLKDKKRGIPEHIKLQDGFKLRLG